MSSGLTRRRGAGAGNPSSDPDNDNEGSRVSSPVPRRKEENTRNPETAYEAGANGYKIAFDPRDISESAERQKQPKLTLMEEVLLMGLKDKQGYLSFWNDNISYALRGCIVLELAFRGRISMQKDSARRRFPLADRVIEVVDDTLTGEVLLDEALKMMKSSEKMSVSAWIDLMSGEFCFCFLGLERRRCGRKWFMCNETLEACVGETTRGDGSFANSCILEQAKPGTS